MVQAGAVGADARFPFELHLLRADRRELRQIELEHLAIALGHVARGDAGVARDGVADPPLAGHGEREEVAPLRAELLGGHVTRDDARERLAPEEPRDLGVAQRAAQPPVGVTHGDERPRVVAQRARREHSERRYRLARQRLPLRRAAGEAAGEAYVDVHGGLVAGDVEADRDLGVVAGGERGLLDERQGARAGGALAPLSDDLLGASDDPAAREGGRQGRLGEPRRAERLERAGAERRARGEEGLVAEEGATDGGDERAHVVRARRCGPRCAPRRRRGRCGPRGAARWRVRTGPSAGSTSTRTRGSSTERERHAVDRAGGFVFVEPEIGPGRERIPSRARSSPPAVLERARAARRRSDVLVGEERLGRLRRARGARGARRGGAARREGRGRRGPPPGSKAGSGGREGGGRVEEGPLPLRGAARAGEEIERVGERLGERDGEQGRARAGGRRARRGRRAPSWLRGRRAARRGGAGRGRARAPGGRRRGAACACVYWPGDGQRAAGADRPRSSANSPFALVSPGNSSVSAPSGGRHPPLHWVESRSGGRIECKTNRFSLVKCLGSAGFVSLVSLVAVVGACSSPAGFSSPTYEPKAGAGAAALGADAGACVPTVTAGAGSCSLDIAGDLVRLLRRDLHRGRRRVVRRRQPERAPRRRGGRALLALPVADDAGTTFTLSTPASPGSGPLALRRRRPCLVQHRGGRPREDAVLRRRRRAARGAGVERHARLLAGGGATRDPRHPPRRSPPPPASRATRRRGSPSPPRRRGPR